MTRMTLFFMTTLLAITANAANPVWQKGKTDEVYEITVYRSASCGCCKGWIEHLQDHNFKVNDVTVDDVTPYKQEYNVPPQAASCHTAQVNGVTIEGHVPAQDIKNVLAANSDIRLLTVPAMPSGTPGMDMPGAPKDNFKVFSISKDNEIGVFNNYIDY